MQLNSTEIKLGWSLIYIKHFQIMQILKPLISLSLSLFFPI